MKKFEADSLEVAYENACKYFDCSITELEYEILQHPSRGVLGIFAKKAIIIADIKKDVLLSKKEKDSLPKGDIDDKEVIHQEVKKIYQKEVIGESPKDIEQKKTGESNISSADTIYNDEVVDSFFNEHNKQNSLNSRVQNLDNKELAKEIETHLKELISSLCFNIDTVEVDVDNNTAYIFIDGEDAALLIGKEGYRYNALSYLLFNWINPNYGLYIKLEIARFLQSQEDMIRNYIQPVVEHVESEGWGRTRPLDGILAQIALEQLRERFPNKYVAIKKNRADGTRYIIINDFIKSN